MKRFFLLVTIMLVALSFGLSAQQSVLIDFSELAADWPADEPRENERTLVDFGSVAGASFTAEQRAQMKTSLGIESWDIELASSSRFVQTVGNSYVRQARVREGAAQFENEAVMGIRVNFPTAAYNSWAMIRPPFEIPAYADIDVLDGDDLIVPQQEEGRGAKFDGFGVVKNVGVLRDLTVNVYGSNFPHGLSVILQDENNVEHEIFLGNLRFDGWRALEWRNPNYIADVRNRELRTFPLYPAMQPMVKLVGFRVYRDAAMQGGDFITYIKDVNISYDRARLDIERDIDDEEVWGILQDRERARREAELRRVGDVQILRFLEEQRLAPPRENNN
ncbi:MAG: flagellar protein [Spirochaetaceae bacterium]|nr:MAG: flagellar protein [Spirochaetaceae bacterium]